MSNSPLVSVCVITYNSADYVIEALESIKSQTYSNIELIISDDSSKDETVPLCKKWIDQNSSRFTRTEIISSKQNTGTSANYNRAVNAANGEWIKFVDGDDMIASSCVADNIDYINSNENARLIFSNLIEFTHSGNINKQNCFFIEQNKKFFQLTTEEQLVELLRNNQLPSASAFINTELLKNNPYNETYGLLEDLPKWIDLVSKGNHVYYFDKVTAYYRIGESVFQSQRRFVSPRYFEDESLYFWSERLRLIRSYHAQKAYSFQRKQLLLKEIAISILRNKKNPLTNLLYQFFNVFIKFFADYKL